MRRPSGELGLNDVQMPGEAGAGNVAKVMPQKGLDVTATVPEIPIITQLLMLLGWPEFNFQYPILLLCNSLQIQRPEQ